MFGVIEGNDGELDPAKWIALIDEHPSLSPAEPREGVNPFSGEPTVFHAPETSARVLDGQEHIGSLEWAQDDSKSALLVSVQSEKDSPKLIEVVQELATRLGGGFKKLEELGG